MPPAESDAYLELSGVRKTFPGVVANDDVDLTVRRGEIHGLLGENGAGKSTLMNVLYGLYDADGGTITLDGERLDPDSPADAIAGGVGMVHQHFMLVPRLPSPRTSSSVTADRRDVRRRSRASWESGSRTSRGSSDWRTSPGCRVSPRSRSPAVTR